MQSSTLPNITANIQSEFLILLSNYSGGAFYTLGNTNTRYGYSAGNTNATKLYFDASRSNEIYGKSDKVLPDNITLIAQIKY